MFERFDYDSLLYIYRGLKAFIESGCGHGFINEDMGHPVYEAGAAGKEGLGDSPEENLLFRMLSELSTRLKEEGIESHYYTWWHDFSDWKMFCQFAVREHRRTWND